RGASAHQRDLRARPPAARAPGRRGIVCENAVNDVVLVSMPFGPLFSPSLGLSLLQPQVQARGLGCRIEYFTLPFADQVVGEHLYSRIASESRAMSRAFVGEWIFSAALFDWPPECVQRYLD